MAISSIVAHKMRSLLTMLGIIIGITSVVCVVALGTGSQQRILSNINSLGTNTLEIFNGKGMGDRDADKVKNLTVADGEVLRKQPYVESTTPNSSSSGTIVYRNKSLTANIKGVGDQYFDVKGIPLVQGRFFSVEDVAKNSSVAVIDENTEETVFGGENPIGKVFLFNKKPFKVIGVVSTKDIMGMNTSSLNIFVPYTAVMNKVTGENHINSLTVKIKDDVDAQVAQKNVTDILTVRHGEKDFFILNTDTLKKTITTTTNTMRLLISCIALISLAVGGIGVMNIMLVSVTERTREIGIRMAIGAKKRDILSQFLVEAALICLIGGVIGIILSMIIGWAFNTFTSNFQMIFSTLSIVLAVLCSTMIGIVFGYIPAKNAANLDPINALAAE
jgi:macrolide transport system ATP-binding/permease protein